MSSCSKCQCQVYLCYCKYERDALQLFMRTFFTQLKQNYPQAEKPFVRHAGRVCAPYCGR